MNTASPQFGFVDMISTFIEGPGTSVNNKFPILSGPMAGWLVFRMEGIATVF
jgi:hypothetical protein